jgi:hypothetical protein
MTNAQRLAKDFKLLGLQDIIRHNEQELMLLDEFDSMYGDKGREARASARPAIMAQLADARDALRIRKEAGGS